MFVWSLYWTYYKCTEEMSLHIEYIVTFPSVFCNLSFLYIFMVVLRNIYLVLFTSQCLVQHCTTSGESLVAAFSVP